MAAGDHHVVGDGWQVRFGYLHDPQAKSVTRRDHPLQKDVTGFELPFFRNGCPSNGVLVRGGDHAVAERSRPCDHPRSVLGWGFLQQLAILRNMDPVGRKVE